VLPSRLRSATTICAQGVSGHHPANQFTRVSTKAVLGGSAGIRVDRQQGQARYTGGLSVHIHMRMRPTESGRGVTVMVIIGRP
jgi:hypothetical protein